MADAQCIKKPRKADGVLHTSGFVRLFVFNCFESVTAQGLFKNVPFLEKDLASSYALTC